MTAARAPLDPGFGRLAVLRAYPRDPLGVLADAFQRCGDVATFKLGPQRMWAVHDPDLVGQVLVVRATAFRRGRLMQGARAMLGDGLLTSEDPLHARQRRLIQPSLTPQRVSRLAAPLAALADARVSAWPSPVDAVPAMRRIALDAVSGTLFGAALSDDEAERVADALSAATPLFGLLSIPLVRHLVRTPLPFARRFRRARADIDAVVRRLIADRRAAEAPGDDLLAALLDADDGEEGMSDSQLRDEAVTLFLAGHETTANALAWATHLVAGDPAVQDRLATEARRVLGDGSLGPAQAQQLVYCGQVIDEVLRLYPPAWCLLRRAAARVEVGPHVIRAGDVVVIALPLLHRHPAIWPDPDVFDPDRFAAAAPTRPRYAYLPFGAGPRACLGRALGLLEARVVLATIVRRYRLRRADAAPVPSDRRFTLRPGAPIRVLVEPRPG
jgi:cytochrome P450